MGIRRLSHRIGTHGNMWKISIITIKDRKFIFYGYEYITDVNANDSVYYPLCRNFIKQYRLTIGILFSILSYIYTNLNTKMYSTES